MLTADLVATSRRGDRLYVTQLKGARRQRAVELADALVDVVAHSVGESRGEVVQSLRALEPSPRDRKLMRGLERLLLQRCTFEVAVELAPEELRRELFQAAAAARKEGRFDRPALLQAAGQVRGVSGDAVERGLFADLKDTHALVSWQPCTGQQLVTEHQLGGAQAVLLRAIRVEVHVQCKDVQRYRDLFRWMKFHRLLWTSERDGDGYRLTIDGPMSLFSQSSRYGLQLALMLPLIREMDRWQLRAEVRWGKARRPLEFRLEGRQEPGKSASAQVRLADDVQRLLDDIHALDNGWKADVADMVINLPGLGVIVPDITLTAPTGEQVHVEVMGYWSRDAVWKRVELAEAGLPAPMVFVLSTRLRVSEEVLGDDTAAALCVYKGVIPAKLVLERAAKALQQGVGPQHITFLRQ